MSGRKAGAMGLVERLAAALAVNEIVRSRRFLGEHTSKEDREELLKLTASELTSTAQGARLRRASPAAGGDGGVHAGPS